MSSDHIERVAKSLGAKVETSHNSLLISIDPARVKEACSLVSAIPGLYHLTTITALDLGPAIELRYHFWEGRSFVTVKTELRKEDLTIESASGMVPAATLYEAEIQDLFGVTFKGNPYVGKRLLLPDEYPADAPPPLRVEADPEKIRKLMGLE